VARTGCVPVGTEAEGKLATPTEQAQAFRQVFGRLEQAAAGQMSPKDRAGIEKDLQATGLTRAESQALVDQVAGKPEALERVKRIATNYAQGIADAVGEKFDGFVKIQTDAGIPPRVAKGIALAGAVLAGSPVSLTTAAVPIIGAWGAFPGLGQLEGLALIYGTAYGTRAVRAFRGIAGRVLERVKRADPDEGRPDRLQPKALLNALRSGLRDDWDEDRQAAYSAIMYGLALGQATRDPRELAQDARRMVDEATPEELEDLAI
jgi:hypothetical protein